MPLRLTLRTLLSYLDDTLEPSQAKIIGAKVTESEQARELMDRIKQVTRRRRLTTPPTSGPGGMDANTIAEYLDNEVTSEKANEVEQVFLASDVHLAEVAACHQILTLVLGEPALVPPSAKRRMYALVKGPEAIHGGKPDKARSKADMDLSSEIEPDQDETLRLGVPAVGGRHDFRNLWIIGLGGTLAACLLVVALWQLVHTPGGPNKDQPKGDGPVLVAENKDPKKTDGPKTDEKKNVKDEIKEPKEGINPKAIEETKAPKIDIEPKIEPIPGIKIEAVKIKEREKIPYQKASEKQVAVGQYLAPGAKEPGVLLQAKVDKNAWTRVGGKNAAVVSWRPLMSLPGTKSTVRLDSEVELVLWGSLPEVSLDPVTLESRATINANDRLDADVTLHRGRLVIRRNRKADKDATVRVRFQNSTANVEEYFDVILEGPGAAVAFERFSELDRNEPFYEDRKNPQRNGPLVMIRCYAYAKSANVSFRQLTFNVDEKQQPVLQWQSGQDQIGPPAQLFIPFWLKGIPAFTEEDDIQARDLSLKAHKTLVNMLESTPVDVALAEFVESAQQAAQREMAMDKKMAMSRATYTNWRHAIRCYAATDDVGYIFDQFVQEKTPSVIRGVCMQTLHTWIGINRDNDYRLLDVVKKNYRPTESIKIMELFHKVSTQDAQDPAKYQQLIENLSNELLPIRVLSHWHLFALVPAGQAIAYDPAAPRPQRDAAARQWARLIPPGQLPPAGAQPAKKEKEKK